MMLLGKVDNPQPLTCSELPSNQWLRPQLFVGSWLLGIPRYQKSCFRHLMCGSKTDLNNTAYGDKLKIKVTLLILTPKVSKRFQYWYLKTGQTQGYANHGAVSSLVNGCPPEKALSKDQMKDPHSPRWSRSVGLPSRTLFTYGTTRR